MWCVCVHFLYCIYALSIRRHNCGIGHLAAAKTLPYFESKRCRMMDICFISSVRLHVCMNRNGSIKLNVTVSNVKPVFTNQRHVKLTKLKTVRQILDDSIPNRRDELTKSTKSIELYSIPELSIKPIHQYVGKHPNQIKQTAQSTLN